MLRTAASIAGETSVDLSEVLCGLDRTNLTLVSEAVLHVGGCRWGTAMGEAWR
jgi:hypothetical protein